MLSFIQHMNSNEMLFIKLKCNQQCRKANLKYFIYWLIYTICNACICSILWYTLNILQLNKKWIFVFQQFRKTTGLSLNLDLIWFGWFDCHHSFVLVIFSMQWKICGRIKWFKSSYQWLKSDGEIFIAFICCIRGLHRLFNLRVLSKFSHWIMIFFQAYISKHCS